MQLPPGSPEKNGSVSNVKILSSVGPQIDSEFKRIISKSTWTPAVCKGEPIRSSLTLDTYIVY